MKRVSVAAVVLMMASLAFGADKSKSAPTSALRAELLAVREAVWVAWFHNDQDALKRLLPAELVAINNGEQEWQGLQKTLESAQQFAAHGGRLVSIRFEKAEIQVYSDVVVVYSLFALETEESGKSLKSTGIATEMFVRRGKSWVNTGWYLDSGS